jgi:glycolate oxidase
MGMTDDSAPEQDIVDRLARALPNSSLIVDPDVLASLSHDEAEWAPAARPLAAVRARGADEVAKVVCACAALDIPVVPRGAGTGLSGAANAVPGCVIIDLSRMSSILEIDTENLIAVAQPGVVNDVLTAAVAEHGLWYPPDPASSPWCTIGGNVATNAGGMCCLKYGVTRDYVLGMQAVVGGPAGAYGTTVRIGRRTTKGVVGYDLAALFVGSEGTLGVVTEVTLRLRALPTREQRTVVGAFDNLVAAGRAVAECTRRHLEPAALELLDRHCLRAVEEWKHLGIDADAEALLLARVDQPGSAGADQAKAVALAFRESGAAWAQESSDHVEADALFAARRLAYPALERLGPVLTEDVCVPRSRIPEMLGRIAAAGQRHQVQIASIAHAGDGNLHPLLVTPPGDDAARVAAQAAFDDILADAITLGGTISGEHGVGLLKQRGLRQEVEAPMLAMHRAIKRALDPRRLFNPGKAIDDGGWVPGQFGERAGRGGSTGSHWS